MDTATWLITYVLLFSLLQLGVYYLYRRRKDGERDRSGLGMSVPTDREGEQPPHPSTLRAAAHDRDAEPAETDSTVCPTCGTKNAPDATFTYCRNCVNRLAG